MKTFLKFLTICLLILNQPTGGFLAYCQEVDTSKVSVDQMIGTNSFIDVPLDKMEALGFIREYHPWTFTEIEDDVFEFNRWNGFWDFDKYYTSLHDMGITVCPALWSSPDWLENNSTNKPVGDGEDATNPQSYSEMAQLLFQYGARYGHTEVDESLLLVNAGQVKKSGLGVLSYFEDWNEQDRDWESRDAEFTAQEYAAMASANVDGHGGTMGEGLGLKTADPTAKFVMGGIYKMGTGYITSMYNWFTANRPDKQWPIDVINMHHYAYSTEINGISPEEDGYKNHILEIVEWRDNFAPDNEIWITEFGYDTNNESLNRINPFGGFSQQEIQAQWIVRTFLIMSSAGVDRAAQFMLRDVDPGPESRFTDSGLTLAASEGYEEKTSWYYVYSLKNILKDMNFYQVIQEDNAAYVYHFKNRAGDKDIYALWKPTTSGTYSSYSLEIPEDPNVLEIIELTDGSVNGTATRLDNKAYLTDIEISERPLFILADYNPLSGLKGNRAPSLFKAFPNPVQSELHLEFAQLSGKTNVTISIYSADGKLAIEYPEQTYQSRISIDINHLPPGFYSVSARTDTEIQTVKILKK